MLGTCDKVAEWPIEEYNFSYLQRLAHGLQWLSLLLHSKKALGSWPLCVEFACSLCACVGFLKKKCCGFFPQSKEMQVRLTGLALN